MPLAAERVLTRTIAHLDHTFAWMDRAPDTLPVDPRVKIVAALALTIAAVSASRWWIPAVVIVGVGAMLLASGMAFRRLAAAWSTGLIFALVVALPAWFYVGHRAVLPVLRAEASLTCWFAVVATTRWMTLLRALRALRVPAVFVLTLGLTFRYLFLLIELSGHMLLARRSRLVAEPTGARMRGVLTATGGVLLSKSMEMSDDVHLAMTARGFRGEMRTLDEFKMRARDYAVLAAAVAMAGCLWAVNR